MLILIVTRQCDLRCSYCPTVKDGWPAMRADDALRALDLFGQGELKLFGGEPLLEAETVATIIDAAAARPKITRITLCTNGTRLTDEWIDRLERTPKLVVALSLDGAADDHDRYRRTPDRAQGSYDAIAPLLPRLAAAPRLYVTQVIPPATAKRAAANFRHLFDLGFRRFKFLPALYVHWHEPQLAALRASLDDIASVINAEWEAGRYVYVRNLFARSTMPAFNRATVVDVDGSVFGTDAIVTNVPPEVRERLRGDVDPPPDLIASLYPESVRNATEKAEEEMRRFCRGLARGFTAWRSARTSPTAAATAPVLAS